MARHERPSVTVVDRLLNWEKITDRRNARPLQRFTCTSECPRSPGGKKLPHPKPFELEVQSHLRESSKRLKNGELLLVGRLEDQTIVAAAHLMFTPLTAGVQTHIASVAVDTNVRGQGGAIANEVLLVIFETAREHAAMVGELALVTGKIHNENRPSEALFVRAGFEPYSVPSGDYQQWVIRLPL